MSESSPSHQLQQPVPVANRDSDFRWADFLTAAVAWGSALIVAGGFCWILVDLLVQGSGQLSSSFFSELPARSGRAGGIVSVLASTGLILLVCLAVSVPIGLGAAIYLSEYAQRDSWLGWSVRKSLDVLAGMPSIVFGLFGNAFFVVWLGMGYSILAGGLTLACMVLPLLIRATEQGLQAVPNEMRLSAAALGMPQSRWIVLIVLPQAATGLVVGLVLGIGRALAETAALLFTSGYVDRMPGSLFDSGRTLSIHIYDLAMNVAGGEPNAYATALVLIGLLLSINLLASWAVNNALNYYGGES